MKRLAIIGPLLLILVAITGCTLFNVNPSPNPTPQPGTILFFDGFEDEADPAWRPETIGTAQWGAENGTYGLKNPINDIPIRTFVGDSSWQNYRVEVDVIYNMSQGQWYWRANSVGTKVAVFLRVKDTSNMVAFFLNPGSTSSFQTMKDGIWTVESEANTPGGSSLRLSVTVKGNTYTAFVNETQITSFDNLSQNALNGYTGLQMNYLNHFGYYAVTHFDNFRVTGL